MLTLRRAQERGHADHGWLDTWHSFSFADYYDPDHMGVSALRVINEDRIAPGGGFPMHPHRDMEIVTYVLSGALEHRDSMGNTSVIRPGEVQRMSAGRGVTHSEHNPSAAEPVHLLQIWIVPHTRGLVPSYEQVSVPQAEGPGRLRLVASPQGGEGAVRVHQDASMYVALLDGQERAEHPLAAGRTAYVQVARGGLSVNGQRLGAGDGATLRGEARVTLTDGEGAEVLVFDLP
jgi:redox-sensitive bicupin YhaK (pirin superfamily)